MLRGRDQGRWRVVGDEEGELAQLWGIVEVAEADFEEGRHVRGLRVGMFLIERARFRPPGRMLRGSGRPRWGLRGEGTVDAEESWFGGAKGMVLLPPVGVVPPRGMEEWIRLESEEPQLALEQVADLVRQPSEVVLADVEFAQVDEVTDGWWELRQLVTA